MKQKTENLILTTTSFLTMLMCVAFYAHGQIMFAVPLLINWVAFLLNLEAYLYE